MNAYTEAVVVIFYPRAPRVVIGLKVAGRLSGIAFLPSLRYRSLLFSARSNPLTLK
jgi:hypothetical protein